MLWVVLPHRRRCRHKRGGTNRSRFPHPARSSIPLAVDYADLVCYGHAGRGDCGNLCWRSRYRSWSCHKPAAVGSPTVSLSKQPTAVTAPVPIHRLRHLHRLRPGFHQTRPRSLASENVPETIPTEVAECWSDTSRRLPSSGQADKYDGSRPATDNALSRGPIAVRATLLSALPRLQNAVRLTTMLREDRTRGLWPTGEPEQYAPSRDRPTDRLFPNRSAERCAACRRREHSRRRSNRVCCLSSC